MGERKILDAGTSLLGAQDPVPSWIINADAMAHAGMVLLCDHASAAIPAVLGDLGLDMAERRRHIAWDIGAADVTMRLAAHFSCPAVFSGFSRLIIDCNRRLGAADSIPVTSDGTFVPGNHGLTAAERTDRAEACFYPYHRMVGATLDAMTRGGRRPIVIAIHSFTPVMNGCARPWHIGILYRWDRRIALPLIAVLNRQSKICVGENVPYSALLDFGATIPFHAEPRGLPHVLLEIRQDLIDTEAGAQAWADILAAALEPIIANPLHTTASPSLCR